jgi:hypothetical protein
LPSPRNTTNPGPWEDDIALRIELHDSPPATDTSRPWQYGPEDVVLHTADDHLTLAIPCQGDLSERWPDDEPPLTLPPKTADKPLRMRLYGRADSNEHGIGDRGESHLLQLWPDPETSA